MTARGPWIAMAALLLAGCQSGNPVPLVLGHVANLSGADHAGTQAERGIRLALKQRTDDNLAEALQGRPLHVRHTDTRGQLDAYESEAVRLAEVNRVIGLIGGATPDEVARLDRSHRLVLAPAGVRPPGASDLVFALGMRPAQQAFMLAKYLAEESEAREIVILADERREEFLIVAEALARQLQQCASAQGKKVAVHSVRFGKDAKWDELAKLIVERRSLGGVIFAGQARDWVELRRKQTLAIPLIFAGDDGDVANLQGGAGKETIYFATAFTPDREAPRIQTFLQNYRDAYKEEPDVAAALGYEALQLYVEALKAISPSFTIEKLQAALREIKDFPGLGGTLTMTADQYVRRTLYIARQDGANLTMLRRYSPG